MVSLVKITHVPPTFHSHEMNLCMCVWNELGDSKAEYKLGKKHADFITTYAAIEVPKRLETVLKLTELLGTKSVFPLVCIRVQM